jgi:class 3 adenylate cyclase
VQLGGLDDEANAAQPDARELTFAGVSQRLPCHDDPALVRSVKAAQPVQQRGLSRAGYIPRLRTGIHLGRPRKIGGDYFGVDVNIAARLAEAAEPGEILVSDRTLKSLHGTALTSTKRRFAAEGAPPDLTAHAVSQPA